MIKTLLLLPIAFGIFFSLLAQGSILKEPQYISPKDLGEVCKKPYDQCIAAGAIDNGLGTGAGPGVWVACINVIARGDQIPSTSRVNRSIVTMTQFEAQSCVDARIARQAANANR